MINVNAMNNEVKWYTNMLVGVCKGNNERMRQDTTKRVRKNKGTDRQRRGNEMKTAYH